MPFPPARSRAPLEDTCTSRFIRHQLIGATRKEPPATVNIGSMAMATEEDGVMFTKAFPPIVTLPSPRMDERTSTTESPTISTAPLHRTVDLNSTVMCGALSMSPIAQYSTDDSGHAVGGPETSKPSASIETLSKATRRSSR